MPVTSTNNHIRTIDAHATRHLTTTKGVSKMSKFEAPPTSDDVDYLQEIIDYVGDSTTELSEPYKCLKTLEHIKKIYDADAEENLAFENKNMSEFLSLTIGLTDDEIGKLCESNLMPERFETYVSMTAHATRHLTTTKGVSKMSKLQIAELAEYLDNRISDYDSDNFTDETDGTNMLEMWITDYFREAE